MSPAENTISNKTFQDDSTYHYDQEVIQTREIEHPIHPIIAARRSTRAMTCEPIDDAVLKSLFEAARWAPSYYNSQTWRFVYSKRDDPHWGAYVDALNERNRVWAQDAAVLMVVLSKKTAQKPGGVVRSPTHSFDAGAAWMAMALEATARGLVVHALIGFDQAKAAKMIQLESDEFHIECMIVVGKRGLRKDGKPEMFTPRNGIDHFVSAGIFNPN